jgi:hypothetical protein
MPRPKKTPARAYVFATATVSVREPGSKYPTSVPQGSAWFADCPLVESHPDLFSPDPPEVFPRGWQSQPVEQATAAPGELRTTGRD